MHFHYTIQVHSCLLSGIKSQIRLRKFFKSNIHKGGYLWVHLSESERKAMIKILHIVNSFDIGGMENGLVNIINYSQSKKFQHAICSLTKIGKMKERVQPDVTYYALEKVEIDRLLFMKIYTVIKNYQPDIVHIRSWGPFF